MDPDVAVGQRLAKLRTDKALRQEDFLDLLEARGVTWTQSTLSRVESGKRALKATELFVIADALNIEAGQLNPVRDTVSRRLHNLRREYYDTCAEADRYASIAERRKARLAALTLAIEVHDSGEEFTVHGSCDEFQSLLMEALAGATGFISSDAACELFGRDRVDRLVAAVPELNVTPMQISLPEYAQTMREIYAKAFDEWLPPSITFKPNPDGPYTFSVDGIDVEDDRARLPHWIQDTIKSAPEMILYPGDPDGR